MGTTTPFPLMRSIIHFVRLEICPYTWCETCSTWIYKCIKIRFWQFSLWDIPVFEGEGWIGRNCCHTQEPSKVPGWSNCNWIDDFRDLGERRSVPDLPNTCELNLAINKRRLLLVRDWLEEILVRRSGWDLKTWEESWSRGFAQDKATSDSSSRIWLI